MTAKVDAAWPAPAGVHAFTTLRHGAGVSKAPFDSFNLGNFRGPQGDEPDAVARNRVALVERFALPSVPHWLRQVHGTAVVRFDAADGPPPRPARPGAARRALEWPARQCRASRPVSPPASGGGGTATRASVVLPSVWNATPPVVLPPPFTGEGRGGGEPEADAAVTAMPGVVLAILTADCLPVVFAAKDGSEIAAAHAGWPGLSKDMLEATLAAMRTPADKLTAWIGPCAGPARYEVGKDVFDVFVAHAPSAASAFAATRPGHWLADLPSLARMRLVAAGMHAADIHGGDLCTISDPRRFFSHRRDGRSGRMATLAWIA